MRLAALILQRLRVAADAAAAAAAPHTTLTVETSAESTRVEHEALKSSLARLEDEFNRQTALVERLNWALEEKVGAQLAFKAANRFT